MSLIEKFFKRGAGEKFDPTHRAILKEVSMEDLSGVLGKCSKTRDGFVFWRGDYSDIDPDFSSGSMYQISSKDYRGSGRGATPAPGASAPPSQRTVWFMLTNNPRIISPMSGELQALAREIEKIETQ